MPLVSVFKIEELNGGKSIIAIMSISLFNFSLK